MSELSAEPTFAAETKFAEKEARSLLTAIVHVPDSGLLAIGNTEDGAAIVVASRDGRRWTRMPEAEVQLGKARVLDMVVAGGRLIAVGSSERRLSAWESQNGLEWSPIDVAHTHQGVGFLSDIAVNDGRVVVVGFEARGASAWVLTADGFDPAETVDADSGSLILDGLTVSEGIFVAGGNDDAGAVVWRSVDGLRWERADLAGPTERAVIKDVESVGGRVVAVGYDHEGPRSWASDHLGETWNVLDGPELSDARPQLLTSAVGVGETVLAVGQGDGSPLCWLLERQAESWRPCTSVGQSEFALAMATAAFEAGTAVAVGRSARADHDGIAIWLLRTQ